MERKEGADENVIEDQKVNGGGEQKLHFNEHLVEGLVAKAVALRPLLAKNAATHEQIGELTPEVVDALTEAGFFYMAAPERVGGLAIPSKGQGRVVAELAKACPSTSWTVSIINSCIWLGSAMSFEMQDYIFADGIPLMCSPSNGSGTLVPEGDHFILNGKWSYGSGSHHSKYALVPAQSEGGAMNFVIVPMAEAKLVNTWKVAGMKGTGSDTVVAENIKIMPNQYTQISGVGETVSLHVSSNGLSPDARKAQLIEATDHWLGLTLLRSKTLAIILGTVQGLLEEVLKTREKGLMFTTYEKRGESQVFQAGIGKAFSKIEVVRTVLDDVTEINDRCALEARQPTNDERISSRAQVTFAVEILTDVTNELMALYGTSGFAESAAAQRFWRDFMVGASHGTFTANPGYETVGKYIMGIEPNITIPTFF